MTIANKWGQLDRISDVENTGQESGALESTVIYTHGYQGEAGALERTLPNVTGNNQGVDTSAFGRNCEDSCRKCEASGYEIRTGDSGAG